MIDKRQNHLPKSFWDIPKCASTTLSAKELKETLLATDGHILTWGEFWEIKSKRIGPGVYKVFLSPEKF